MQSNQYYAHDKRNVNETAGYVKRQKPKEPQNNHNRSEYRQHDIFPPFHILLSPDPGSGERRNTYTCAVNLLSVQYRTVPSKG